MDLVVHAFDKLEAERLVPADGENVERDLATDRETQVHIGELSPKRLNEGFAHAGSLVELLELIALLLRAVAPDWAHVNHAVAELDEGAALDRDVEISDVVQDEVDESLETILPQVLVDTLLLNLDSELVCVESILCEAPIGCIDHRGSHLLPHLDEVAAGDDAEVDSFRSHLRDSLEHLWGDQGASRSQGHIDIKEGDDTLLLLCHYLN